MCVVRLVELHFITVEVVCDAVSSAVASEPPHMMCIRCAPGYHAITDATTCRLAAMEINPSGAPSDSRVIPHTELGSLGYVNGKTYTWMYL